MVRFPREVSKTPEIGEGRAGMIVERHAPLAHRFRDDVVLRCAGTAVFGGGGSGARANGGGSRPSTALRRGFLAGHVCVGACVRVRIGVRHRAGHAPARCLAGAWVSGVAGAVEHGPLRGVVVFDPAWL